MIFCRSIRPPQAGKPPERDQILTEIFDYVRGGINLIDTSTGAKPYAGNTYSGDLRAAPSGTGHVVPIQIGDTRGFGRSMTLYSPILLLTGLEAEVVPNGAVDSNNDGYYKGPSEKAKLAQIRTKKIQAMFLMDTFSPSQGTTRFVPNLVFKVTGLDKLTLDGTSMGFPASAEMNYNTYANDHEYAWGGYVNHAAFFFDRLLGAYMRKVIGSGSLDYKLVSSVISLDKEYKKGELILDGGEQIFVEIYAKDAAGAVSGSYIQRIPLKFPQVTVPVPTVRGIYRHSYTAAFNPTVPTNTTAQSSSFKYGDALTASTASVNSPGVVNTHYNVGSIEGQTIYHVSRALVPSHGDMRLVLGQRDLPDSLFVRGRGYNSTSDKDYNSLWKVYLGEETSGGMVGSGPTSSIGGSHSSTSGKLVPAVTYDQHIGSSIPASANDRGPAVSSLINGVFLTGRDGNPAAGDWDTAMGGVYDGPYINKADEGERGAGAYKASNAKMSVASLFSPNRQVPSPGILGSLPTGVLGNKPWQTLLLCPNPAAKSQHPGSRTPPDHLWLDLFWMPVVEPYAISEPFSTAGKINLNYQIVPFTNIERNTGLQAVLKSTRVSAIPTADGKRYKSVPITDLYRHPIDLDETLLGFEERIANNQPFRSASEICDMFLVPADKGATFANIATWWDNYQLTGDNLREHPYTGLYSRLTTKSNSYTVHTRVQLLKKVPNSNIGQWDERKDKVLGEYRGAISIERYLDPNLASYDPASPLTGYRFRTVSTKAFTP